MKHKFILEYKEFHWAEGKLCDRYMEVTGKKFKLGTLESLIDALVIILMVLAATGIISAFTLAGLIPALSLSQTLFWIPGGIGIAFVSILFFALCFDQDIHVLKERYCAAELEECKQRTIRAHELYKAWRKAQDQALRNRAEQIIEQHSVEALYEVLKAMDNHYNDSRR